MSREKGEKHGAKRFELRETRVQEQLTLGIGCVKKEKNECGRCKKMAPHKEKEYGRR